MYVYTYICNVDGHINLLIAPLEKKEFVIGLFLDFSEAFE